MNNEQTLDEFEAVLRKRDLFSEFVEWYRERHAGDPDSFPLSLTPMEWFDTFGDFLTGVEPR